ncbi:autoinducer binding domain-containing protein [Paraburkholderia megapolitana]|uniref:autoinducer binding domain-containing protein n=1 Tax=Paraburkholderia megapolitana TaxID=420953 RepID=UPI0038BD063C
MSSEVRRLVKMFVSTGLDYEIKMRIYEQEMDVVVERETHIGAGREGEVSFTLVYADTAPRIEGLISNDPDDHLRMRGTEYLTSLFQYRSVERGDPVADQIQTLAGIASEAKLSRTILELIKPLGASAFVAMNVSSDPQTRQPRTYVALVAGDNGFLQVYAQKRWFAIDPFLTHAAASNTPMYSSTIGLLENLTGSWRDMGVSARSYGLCSWAGFPTHRPGTNDFGILYIASPTLPADGGERPFQEKTVYLRGLAAEIFDWQLAARRAQDLNDRNFNARDLRVLKAVASGNTAKDIASALDISERDVLKRVFPEVVAKARTRNIRDAARYATDRGLLPTLDGRKVVYVAVSDTHGIYLGALFGAPFWSKINPSGIRDAFAFATEPEAREILSSVGINDGYHFVRVEVDQSADTVAEEICVAFGMPAWHDSNVLSSHG